MVHRMKPRKLRLVADVSGFATAIAEVHIANFASEPELKDWTDLVCPTCLTSTEYHGAGYECKTCNQTYSWWGKLVRVLKGTKTKLDIPRLIKEHDIATGKLSKMTRAEFAKYVDATKAEKGVTQVDSGSTHNLFKLLVASERAGYVIIVRYNDTTEEVVALLKVSASGRVILQEIIPKNLVQLKQTLVLNMNEVNESEVSEARAFVEQFLPTATEKTLEVSDYRTMWIDQHIITPEREETRVVQIKEIMAKVKAS
jgi:hypothetical protein